MIDYITQSFEKATVIKEAHRTGLKRCTSELTPLDWEELKDDDLIEVSHSICNGENEEDTRYESRCISFKDLCHATKVNLMMDGAIQFQGED